MHRIFRSFRHESRLIRFGYCNFGGSVAFPPSGVSICLIPPRIHIWCLGMLAPALFSIGICHRAFLSVSWSVVWRFGSLFAFRCF